MAPLEHADSIIEESIISTSPYRPDTDDASTAESSLPSLPARKVRVTKTYGKPKTDGSTASYDHERRAHTLRTAPPDTEIVIPESEDASTSSFKWKQQLKEIDHKFDNQDTMTFPDSSKPFTDEDPGDVPANPSIFDGTLSPLSSETSQSNQQASTQTIPDDDSSVQVDVSHVESLDANSSAEESRSGLGETSRNKKRKEVKKKPKKTSKKELMEIQKESARLLAERSVELRRPEYRPARTVHDLFAKLKFFQKAPTGDSDPISTSSSPDKLAFPQQIASSLKKSAPSLTHSHSTPPEKLVVPRDEGSDSDQASDAELPTAESILEEETAKRAAKLTEESRMKELQERKAAALVSKNICTTDSEDDLEVEGLVTSKGLRHEVSIANAFRDLPQLRHRRGGQGKEKSKIDLELVAKPMFSANATIIAKSTHSSVVSPGSLNQILLRRVEEQSIKLEEKKRMLWIQQGGSLKATLPPKENAIESWILKGLNQDGRSDKTHEIETSGETRDDMQDENDYEDTKESDDAQEHISADEDEDKENQKPMSRRARSRVVVDSDEENDWALADPVILAYDSSFRHSPVPFTVYHGEPQEPVNEDRYKANVIFDYDTSDENDENSAFPTCESNAVRRGSHTNGNLRIGVASPNSRCMNQNQSSRVLQVLHEEDKGNTLASVYSSPSDSAVGNSFSASTELFEGSTLVSPDNFSQLFADKQKASTNQQSSPSPLGPGGFTQFFSQFTTKIFENEEFEFTQPNALLPSVRISGSQRREVDDMFNKDQEFRLEEAKRVRLDAQQSGSKLSKTPYFGSFIASPQAEICSIIRQPLASMSLTSIQGESSPTRLTRLRRERHQDRESLSPIAPKVLDAFQILKDTGAKKPQKGAREINKSEYIEREAQESDDESYIGFGRLGKNRADDEEEDEDQDAIVEGLVDDATLDDKTLAAGLVLEKHKEFEEENDAALLKLHQDAIEGKLRVKRKNMGLGFDDSESEDEDDHRPRKSYPKKRRIEGDTLEACAQNPDTRAFFDAYQLPLLEDEEDRTEINPVGHSLEKKDSACISEDEEEDENIVGTRELMIELRERALQAEENEDIRPDLEDVTWVDADELRTSEDVDVQVEQGVLQGNLLGRSAGSSTFQFNRNLRVNDGSNQEKMRLLAWANEESQSRSAGGRGGFSRKGHKTRGGSPRPSGKNPTIDGLDNDSFKKPPVAGSFLITSVQKQKRFED